MQAAWPHLLAASAQVYDVDVYGLWYDGVKLDDDT